MIIDGHNKLKESFRIRATRIIIYDDKGNPLAAAIEITPNHILVGHAGDPDFVRLLDMLKVKPPAVTEAPLHPEESQKIIISKS